MTTFFNSQTPNQSTDSTDFSRFDWLLRARIFQSPKQSTGATDFSRFDCFSRFSNFVYLLCDWSAPVEGDWFSTVL